MGSGVSTGFSVAIKRASRVEMTQLFGLLPVEDRKKMAEALAAVPIDATNENEMDDMASEGLGHDVITALLNSERPDSLDEGVESSQDAAYLSILRREMQESRTPLAEVPLIAVCTQSGQIKSTIETDVRAHTLVRAFCLKADPAFEALTLRQLKYALSDRVHIFRIPVPPHREGQLGAGGLHLRKGYGIHVFGLETADGQIDFKVGLGSKVSHGDFLWAGLESGQQFGTANDNLIRFLSPSMSVSTVEMACLPVFKCPAPEKWHGKSMLSLNLRFLAGITVCALMRGKEQMCYPAPHHVLQDKDILYLSVQSISGLLNMLSAAEVNRLPHGSETDIAAVTPQSPTASMTGLDDRVISFILEGNESDCELERVRTRSKGAAADDMFLRWMWAEMEESRSPLAQTDMSMWICSQGTVETQMKDSPIKDIVQAFGTKLDQGYESTSVKQMGAALRKRMLVFRVPVLHRSGEIGPAGLNLRQTYGMHAVGVEGENGSIDFDLNVHSKLSPGDVLWVGLEHGENGMEALATLAEFLGTDDLDSCVEVAHMPVFQTSPRKHWINRTVEELGLRAVHGITLVATEQLGQVKCFPSPTEVINANSRLYFSIGSIKNCLKMMSGKESSSA